MNADPQHGAVFCRHRESKSRLNLIIKYQICHESSLTAQLNWRRIKQEEKAIFFFSRVQNKGVTHIHTS